MIVSREVKWLTIRTLKNVKVNDALLWLVPQCLYPANHEASKFGVKVSIRDFGKHGIKLFFFVCRGLASKLQDHFFEAREGPTICRLGCIPLLAENAGARGACLPCFRQLVFAHPFTVLPCRLLQNAVVAEQVGRNRGGSDFAFCIVQIETREDGLGSTIEDRFQKRFVCAVNVANAHPCVVTDIDGYHAGRITEAANNGALCSSGAQSGAVGGREEVKRDRRRRSKHDWLSVGAS